jgi:hypothetical protein
MSTRDTGPGKWGRLSPQPRDEIRWPFCGDEYPLLKGSPGTVVCTKAQHAETEMHLNEETGWMWPSEQED